MQHLATRTSAELLREGVAASKSGNEELARELFLQAALEDSNDENPWVCLASVTDAVHIRMGYIRRALELNPHNTRARMLLEAARKSIAAALVETAKDSVKNGNHQDAAHFLLAAAEFDAANEESWIGQACLNAPVEDREIILRHGLQANPSSERLQTMLQTIQQRPKARAATAESEALKSDSTRPMSFAREPLEFLEAEPVDPTPLESSASLDLQSSDYPGLESSELLALEPAATPAPEPSDGLALEPLEPFAVEHSEQAELEPATFSSPEASEPFFAEPEESLAVNPWARLTLEPSEPLSLEPPPAPLAFEPSESLNAGSEDLLAVEPAEVSVEMQPESNDPDLDRYPAVPASLDADIQFEVIDDDADAETAAPAPAADSSLQIEDHRTAITLENDEPVRPVSEAKVTVPAESPAPPEPARIAPENSNQLHNIPDGCPLCLEALSGQPERCPSCGGRLKLWDPRIDSKDFAPTRVDQRKMLLAVNRCSVTLRNDPQNSQLHYTLGLAYLNLNRLDVAIRCLKRSDELSPSPQVKAGIDRLSKPPSLSPPPVVVEAPRQLASEATVLGPKGEEQKPQTQAKPAAAGNSNAPKREKDTKNAKTILVIDDSPTIRRVVSVTLERQGYQVLTAVDGPDGLAKLLENRVDLVLLDIILPKLDGYQVCKSIREKKKALPVIMLSGKDGFFDKVRGKMAGSTAYITKPFEQEALLSAVQTHCALT